MSGIQAKFYELCVLVAVADDEAVGFTQLCHCDDQLSLAARFKAVIVLTPIIGYFFYHMALLVHLYGVDAAVAVAVSAFFYSSGERFIEHLHSLIEQVANTQYGGHVQAALVHSAHNVRHADVYRLAFDLDVDLDVTCGSSFAEEVIKYP